MLEWPPKAAAHSSLLCAPVQLTGATAQFGQTDSFATMHWCFLHVFAGLGIQLLLFPDSLPDDEPGPSSRLPKEPQLPKVTVTSSPQEIKAAFEAVARSQNSSSSSIGAVASSSGSSSSSSGTSSPGAAAAEAAAAGSSSSVPTMAGATSSSDNS